MKKSAARKTARKPAPIGHNRRSNKSAALIEKGRTYFSFAVKPRDVVLEKGKGAKIWDMDGRDYVDFGAGIAVTSLGHHDRDLMKALVAQAGKVWHTSNTFFSEPPILLAEELVESSKFARRVFFCNSGAEANEGAIKLVRKYAADKGRPPAARNIITFTGSFHGRTLATVTATAQPKYQAGFEPLPGGFIYCPFNDFAAVERMVDGNTCAVMAEVIQGEGGVMPMKPGFLKHLRQLCDKVGALLILDDVQCGMGRAGHLFSYFADGVKPDVVTLAKALGGGMPIGALLIGDKAENTFQFGSHGSTFGGNPLATAVARVVLKKLQSKALQKNIADRNKQLVAALAAFNKRHGIFADIRGRGLMIGAELTPRWHGKAGEMGDLARAHGVLILQAGPNVLRFLPPLTITGAEMKEGLKRLETALSAYIRPAKA